MTEGQGVPRTSHAGSLRIGLLGLALLVAVAGLVAVSLVDNRLDQQWGLRAAMLVLALISIAVLLRPRISTRVIGVTGILLWGVLAPIVTTLSATPEEMDFALAVADEARRSVTLKGNSSLAAPDVEAAVKALGGAVGPRPGDPGPGAGAVAKPGGFTVLARPDPARSRPRVCLSYDKYGFEVDIRRC